MHAVAKGLYSESKSEGQCGERAELAVLSEIRSRVPGFYQGLPLVGSGREEIGC